MPQVGHDAAVVAEDSPEGFVKSFTAVLEIVIWVVSTIFDKATDVYAMSAMLVFLGVGWYFGGAIAHSVYMATCAQIHCPHFTNIRSCGMPWGFCIQDIMCPCICHKYRPMFGLRLHIVKARYLDVGVIPGDIKVYCRVWAGNNPLKTTSMQSYNNPNMITGAATGDLDRTGWQTVIWNEPVDLQIYPSTGQIQICLHTLGLLGNELTMGTVYLDVGGFYEEDKAVCSYLWFGCCDYCPPCFPKFLFKPQWPLIKGAPSLEELQQHHELTTATCAQSISRSIGLDSLKDIGAGLFENAVVLDDKELNPNTVTEILADDGMQLKNANPMFKKAKETVVIAVRDHPDAMQFASKKLRNDIQIQRIQYRLPEPMMLEIYHYGNMAGYMWAYTILTHEVSCETELRSCITCFLRTFCCCCDPCIRFMTPQRTELPNYQFVGEPVGIEDDF